jgi:hypothetical protein
VVRPPIKPVVRNNLISGVIESGVLLNSIIKPIRIPPATFTNKVPYGKRFPNNFGAFTDIAYLKQVPINPPIPT